MMNRSVKKGPFVKIEDLTKNKKEIKEIPRNFKIVPNIVGSKFKIYNGKKFLNIDITEDMIGHKIGEFAPTREKFSFKKKKKK